MSDPRAQVMTEDEVDNLLKATLHGDLPTELLSEKQYTFISKGQCDD
jgi:hypothetical protein